MPVTASAEKKMRKDKNRTWLNKKRKGALKSLYSLVQKDPRPENLRQVQSAIDKLAKVKVIHKNKASRLKSQLARLVGKRPLKTEIIKKVKSQKSTGKTSSQRSKE